MDTAKQHMLHHSSSSSHGSSGHHSLPGAVFSWASYVVSSAVVGLSRVAYASVVTALHWVTSDAHADSDSINGHSYKRALQVLVDHRFHVAAQSLVTACALELSG